jgi:hypothetical protein
VSSALAGPENNEGKPLPSPVKASANGVAQAAARVTNRRRVNGKADSRSDDWHVLQ